MAMCHDEHPYLFGGALAMSMNAFIDIMVAANGVEAAWSGIFPWSIGFILALSGMGCSNGPKEYQQRHASFFIFGMLQVFLTPTLISAAKMSPWSSIGISSLTIFAVSALADAALTCRKSDEQAPLMRV